MNPLVLLFFPAGICDADWQAATGSAELDSECISDQCAVA